MTKLKYIIGLSLALVLGARAEDVAKFLQDVSVTVKSEFSEGSGVLFSRQTASKDWVTFVWTAGHVIRGLRTIREVVTPDGAKKTVVEFKDARIAKELLEQGRTVGRLELDAEVIRYSNADDGDDLALLRLRKQNYVQVSARFYLDAETPPIGSDLYHVGSLLGQMGANSMTAGILSQQGRLIGKKVFDQTTVAAFPGSSGGGVFLRDGRYIGMLVRGSGETFNLIVPVRRLSVWARSAQIEWAINPSVPLPSEAALAKMPIEDVGHEFITAPPAAPPPSAPGATTGAGGTVNPTKP